MTSRLGNTCRKFFALAERSWYRNPALQVLLCYLLADIYVHESHGSPLWWGMICGFLLLALSLIFSSSSRLVHRISPYLPSIAFRIGIACVLVSLFSLRIVGGSEMKLRQAETNPLRGRLTETLSGSSVSPEVQRLCAAISLGLLPRGEASDELRQQFVRSGVAHILAVSGFHLGVVVFLFSILLQRVSFLPLNPRWRSLLLLLAAWGFVALSGWAVPTVRAAVMLSLYLGGRMLIRPVSTTNILAASALIQLLLAPQLIHSAGFALSYIAVLSIHLFYRPTLLSVGAVRQPILGYIWSMLALTLAAQVLVLPLCLYYFGQISWAFLWTSLPVGMLAVVLMPISLILYALGYFGLPFLGLDVITEYLGQMMLYVTEHSARIDWLHQHYRPELWHLLLYWLAMMLLAIWIRRDEAALTVVRA
ncbi:MAG: ComEC/Rec2 family competence protein [Porphyromonadaceae bacterium]|nr:ComEC/Rec2 family competence protein [Porphyromonadaceae bacterium]